MCRAYTVRLIGSGSQHVASASRQAEIMNFISTVRVSLDLSGVPAGDYLLAGRRDDSHAWSFYPTTVR